MTERDAKLLAGLSGLALIDFATRLYAKAGQFPPNGPQGTLAGLLTGLLTFCSVTTMPGLDFYAALCKARQDYEEAIQVRKEEDHGSDSDV